MYLLTANALKWAEKSFACVFSILIWRLLPAFAFKLFERLRLITRQSFILTWKNWKFLCRNKSVSSTFICAPTRQKPSSSNFSPYFQFVLDFIVHRVATDVYGCVCLPNRFQSARARAHVYLVTHLVELHLFLSFAVRRSYNQPEKPEKHFLC